MKHAPFIVGDFNIKSVKEDDTDYFIVSGYASVYGNLDKARDIVMPGAFATDLIENGNERPILWQHNSDQPIGVGLFEEKEEGLKVEIKLPKADDFVTKRVMPQIKCGAVKGLSIGYYIVEEQWNNDERVNYLKKLRLRETSAVTFACNPAAQITAAKQFIENYESKNKPEITMFSIADDKTPWSKSEAIKDIKANTGCEDAPSRNYYKGFLDVKSVDSKNFEDYNLPYVKFIDGEFKIVPKAIYQIAGNISDSKSDNSHIKEFVNSVYKKMGQEEPFKADDTFFVDSATLSNMEKSDLESVFDNKNVILSTNAKKLIVKSLRFPTEEGSVTGDESDEVLSLLKGLNQEMETK